MATFSVGEPTDLDSFFDWASILSLFESAEVVTSSGNQFVLRDEYDGVVEILTLTGTFGGQVDGYPTTGTITGGTWSISNFSSFTFDDISISVEEFTEFVQNDDVYGLFQTLFEGDDTVTGSSGDDLLYAFDGDDELAGGGGADVLNGGAGNDIYYVDGDDIVTELSGEGADTIVSSSSLILGANIENGTLTVAGSLTGNTQANVLQGSQANDILSGGDGADTLSGGLGSDTLTGGTGADSFRGTAAELNGDTITDLAMGESIVISDANLANFTQSVSGNTLTYSGGSLTFGSALGGTLVASAAAGGGVQLTLSNTPPPPPPPPPAITRAKLILTESGQDVSIGGNVAVFGTTAGGEVIEVVRGDVTLDASFNAGGDTVVLPDDAGSYTATLVGSFVVIESGDLRVSIPVGLAGMAVQFADSTRTLQIDGGQVMLGDQQVTAVEADVDASGPALSDPAETGPDSFAKLILGLPGQDLDVGGNVNVFGTASGGEVITVLGGTVRLDASFNAGGDTVVLPGSVEDYGATLSGSFVTITDGDTSVAIPVGIAGMTVAFDDASLTLVINTTNGTVELGGQVVPSSGQGDWDYLVDSDKGDALDAAMAPMPAAEAHDLGFERIDITDHFTFG